MLFISNRGNLSGPNLQRENDPEYIEKALKLGYHVAVDVWLIPENNQPTLALGDLQPKYKVSLDFLQSPGIIARTTNIVCLQYLLSNCVHVVTNGSTPSLSSQGLIWTPAGSRIVTPERVLVMPEWFTSDLKTAIRAPCKGFCSDYISSVKRLHDQAVAESVQSQEVKELVKPQVVSLPSPVPEHVERVNEDTPKTGRAPEEAKGEPDGDASEVKGTNPVDPILFPVEISLPTIEEEEPTTPEGLP